MTSMRKTLQNIGTKKVRIVMCLMVTHLLATYKHLSSIYLRLECACSPTIALQCTCS